MTVFTGQPTPSTALPDRFTIFPHCRTTYNVPLIHFPFWRFLYE
jgi:hypothetical protein